MKKYIPHKNADKNKKEQELAINKAFRELGSIDKKHESGKFTTKQHDSKSKKALKKLVKAVKK